MKITRSFCPKCGRYYKDSTSEENPFNQGVCSKCSDKLERDFKRAGELDYTSQSELKDRYGETSIEKAYVKKHFGTPKQEEFYKCDECGEKMYSEPPPTAIRTYSPNPTIYFDRNFIQKQLCSSCRRALERREKKEEEDRKRDIRDKF